MYISECKPHPTSQFCGLVKKKNKMMKILYLFEVSSLMYVKMCARLDIAHIVSHFLVNMGKELYEAIM